ncbi:MAG: WecB/TagA/CpsF family glycosyltransferase [Paracoccaceae bacterium]
MIDRGKESVLGVNISVIDYEAASARIVAAAHAARPCSVSALAVHGVMEGALNPEHKFRLNRLDLVTPDGQPVRWALRWLYGESLPDRVYGPRLTEIVFEQAEAEGLPIYLYGSRPEVLQAMTARLATEYPDLKIAGQEPSKFRPLTDEETQDMQARIKASGARIVLVGLGCPRQETFVYENSEAVGVPMLAVGAAFDFFAGNLRQAPKWMQDRGLEWLFRLAMEPRRLWRRYVFLNPLYVMMLTGQLTGILSRRLTNERQPQHDIRYG